MKQSKQLNKTQPKKLSRDEYTKALLRAGFKSIEDREEYSKKLVKEMVNNLNYHIRKKYEE